MIGCRTIFCIHIKQWAQNSSVLITWPTQGLQRAEIKHHSLESILLVSSGPSFAPLLAPEGGPPLHLLFHSGLPLGKWKLVVSPPCRISSRGILAFLSGLIFLVFNICIHMANCKSIFAIRGPSSSSCHGAQTPPFLF